jgi:hypothetical protein
LWLAIGLLVAAPILVHVPELAGLISCDPLLDYAGLAVGHSKHWLRGECYVDGNVGLTLQALGHASADSWLAGKLPWWNPFNGAGLPLAAEMQPASFFLPFILLLHFANGVLLIKLCMQILAGLCMLGCLLELCLSLQAALLGALLYSFNGTFAWFGDAPILPIAFLPMLIWGIERARTRAIAAQPGGVSIIALALAFSLLAGFPETAFVDGVLGAAWCAMVLSALPRGSRVAFICKLSAATILGLCLSAPAVVTFLDYLRNASLSMRVFVDADRLQYGQGAALILPMLLGPPYQDQSLAAWTNAGGFIGTGTACLAAAAILSPGPSVPLRRLAFFWVAFWIAVFLGEPVARGIWHAFPALNQVAVTRYAMPSLEFSASLLAAWGWDDWRVGRLRVRMAMCTIIAMCAVAIWAAASQGRIGPFTVWSKAAPPVSIVAWATIVVAGLYALFRRHPTPPRLFAASCLLAIDAIASFSLPIGAGRLSGKLDLNPVVFLSQQPGLARSYGLNGRLDPNYGAFFNVPTIQSFSVPLAKNWADYAGQIDPILAGMALFRSSDLSASIFMAHRAQFEQAGVGYVLVDPANDKIAPYHDPHLVPVFESAAARIYRMPAAAPYFDVLHGQCKLTVESRVHVTAACDQPALLMRRELFFPGWHVSINGHKAPLLQQAGIFQAVQLPAGPSIVDWEYVPEHARLILCAVLFGIAGMAFQLSARRRGRNTDDVAPGIVP